MNKPRPPTRVKKLSAQVFVTSLMVLFSVAGQTNEQTDKYLFTSFCSKCYLFRWNMMVFVTLSFLWWIYLPVNVIVSGCSEKQLRAERPPGGENNLCSDFPAFISISIMWTISTGEQITRSPDMVMRSICIFCIFEYFQSSSSTVGLAGCDAAALLFKSQSSVSVNTGVSWSPNWFAFLNFQLSTDKYKRQSSVSVNTGVRFSSE